MIRQSEHYRIIWNIAYFTIRMRYPPGRSIWGRVGWSRFVPFDFSSFFFLASSGSGGWKKCIGLFDHFICTLAHAQNRSHAWVLSANSRARAINPIWSVHVCWSPRMKVQLPVSNWEWNKLSIRKHSNHTGAIPGTFCVLNRTSMTTSLHGTQNNLKTPSRGSDPANAEWNLLEHLGKIQGNIELTILWKLC